jgi:hypothetical protein
MFVKTKEYTINTDQITYIMHHPDGSIDVHLPDGKFIYLDASDARTLLISIAMPKP